MPKRRQKRKIHIGSDVWTYVIGTAYIVIRDPEGKSSIVAKSKIAHYEEYGGYDDGFSRGGYFLTPGVIKDYICRILRPGGLIPVPLSYEQTKAVLFDFYGFAGVQE